MRSTSMPLRAGDTSGVDGTGVGIGDETMLCEPLALLLWGVLVMVLLPVLMLIMIWKWVSVVVFSLVLSG